MRRWGLLVSCVVAVFAGIAPPALAARRLETSTWRVERIVVGVARRNASRW